MNKPLSKNLIRIIALILCLATLTGCSGGSLYSNYRELEQLTVIETMGFTLLGMTGICCFRVFHKRKQNLKLTVSLRTSAHTGVAISYFKSVAAGDTSTIHYSLLIIH